MKPTSIRKRKPIVVYAVTDKSGYVWDVSATYRKARGLLAYWSKHIDKQSPWRIVRCVEVRK